MKQGYFGYAQPDNDEETTEEEVTGGDRHNPKWYCKDIGC